MQKSKYELENLEQRNAPRKVRVEISYHCRQCGHYLCYDKDIRENFCPKCGQRLDWLEVDKGVLVKTEHGLEIAVEEEYAESVCGMARYSKL